jgi:hypothetical protein
MRILVDSAPGESARYRPEWRLDYVSQWRAPRFALPQSAKQSSANMPDQPPAQPAAATRTPYKYGAELSAIPGCPGVHTAAFSGSSYRAVHSNHSNPENFLPRAVLDPALLKKCSKKCKCRAWGLSLFESAEQLRALLISAENTSRKLRKKLGDHYARFELTSADGMRTAASETGHFTFFEFVTFSAEASVKEYAPLFP